MRKIAIVHSRYADESLSGENNVVDDQLAELQTAFDARLFESATAQRQSSSLAFRIHAAANASGFRSNTELIESIRKWSPDLIHIHNTFPNIGHSWLSSFDQPKVVTLHNYRTVCANGLLFRDGEPCHDCVSGSALPAVTHGCYRGSRIQTLPLAIGLRPRGQHPLLKNSNRIICLNTDAAKFYGELGFAEKISTIPNFVQSPPIPRRKNGDSFLFAGRLSPEKGVLELLAQWPRGHKLIIAGDGPLRADVQQKCGTRTEITFRGPLHRNELYQLLAESAGLILPSVWSEGIPTVALEALSAGTPLIVSRRCSSHELLVCHGAGLLYDPQDADSLSSSVPELIASRKKFGNAAWKNYIANFSGPKWLERISIEYERAASSHA